MYRNKSQLFCILGILLLVVFTKTLIAQNLDQDSNSSNFVGKKVEIRLKDNTIIEGLVKAEDQNSYHLTSISGVEMIIPKDRVRIIEVQQPGHKRFRFIDPNYTRMMLAPTGWLLKRGQGYFADYYIFFPSISYGITNNISFCGGFSIIPGLPLDLQLKYFIPRFGTEFSDLFSLSGGFLYMDYRKIGIGLTFASATYGSIDKNITAGLALGYVRGKDEDFKFARRPVLFLGGNYRISNSIALLVEGWFIPFKEINLNTQPFALCIRFFGEKVAADMGFIIINILIEKGFPIPWLSFTYNFGH
jgi:hypothetical protein